MQKIEYANAKVNLHLEILKKRSDGYHDIFSVMASTNLHDLLQLNKLDLCSDNTVKLFFDNITGEYKDLIRDLPTEDNLIYKAASLYFEKVDKSAIIHLDIEKNIPAGGGLGGGSSDAAAMLRLLNNELNYYTEQQMLEIAEKVGADVPFCLKGGIAICEGIGEIIEPIDVNIPYSVVIVNNGTHVNTKEAYSYIDMSKQVKMSEMAYKERKNQIKSILKNRMLDDFNTYFKNDFEEPVFKKHFSVESLKNKIKDLGADFTIMTGSGSTIIGLFKNKNIANKACKSLLNIDKVLQVHLASFVTR